MATITIPESTYSRLRVWAAESNQTVDEAVTQYSINWYLNSLHWKFDCRILKN